jgi:calcineurin-like phosphoesterase family protein
MAMSKVWFSADAHYGHKRIIEYCDRPFASVDEMDRELIDNWNEVVGREDDVYFLGDFSLSFKIVKQVVPLLKGKIHLVAGNHDLCHSCNTDSGAYLRHYQEAGFFDICQSTRMEIDGQSVLCCHMPYFNVADPDQRYPEYKPEDDGGWLLHGHVHHRWQVNDRQINVGVDVWDFYPVSMDVIAGLIKADK